MLIDKKIITILCKICIYPDLWYFYITADEGEISSTPGPGNYKKLIADDRALREKAAAKVSI